MTVVRLAAVLVAAGRSRRMGSDKLWIDVWGRPTWRWSLDLLLATPRLERVALAVPAGGLDRFRSHLPETDIDRCLLVFGGEVRTDSALAGLDALSSGGLPDDALVLVHDAARPAASRELVDRVVAAADEADGVVPVIGLHDTLMTADGSPVTRDGLVAAQTPQLGRLGALRSALRANRTFTDEASALAAAGALVRQVAGDPANRKLTEPSDAELLRAVLRGRSLPLRETLDPATPIGIGFDAHRFEAGRRLRLGGLDFPDEPAGLAGHSDGDAALHAIIDALLGAAGAGDIGTLFPADEQWRDADSGDLLSRAVERIAACGWRPAAVDLVIVASRPAIVPRRDEMAQRIAEQLGVEAGAISVKGTTSDGLGFAGREGIAAYALATLRPA